MPTASWPATPGASCRCAAGLSRRGSRVRAVHLAEVLDGTSSERGAAGHAVAASAPVTRSGTRFFSKPSRSPRPSSSACAARPSTSSPRARRCATAPGRSRRRRSSTSTSTWSGLIDNVERAGRSRPLRDDRPTTRAGSSLDIARRTGARMAVKSKSMATEEIHLNEALEAAGITPVETDLGEYIIQLAHERPSHIIAPAIHKTKGQVAELFARELKRPAEPDPEVLTRIARVELREKFLEADLGITGANFARGRHRHRRAGHQRGQRPHGDLAAARARGGDGRREGRALDDRPRGLPGHPGQERDRTEALRVHHARPGPAPRRASWRGPRSSTSSCSTTAASTRSPARCARRCPACAAAPA